MNQSIELFGNKIARVIQNNSPTIFTVLGATGVVLTAVLSGDARLKAHRLVQVERDSREKDSEVEGYKNDPLSKKDIFLLSWKAYIPTVAMGLTTISCIIAANSINLKRNAALAGLYSITEASLIKYQEKVIQNLGERKAEKLQDEIRQERLDENPVIENQVIITGNGDSLCYDSLSGRYFKSNVESIKKAINDFNLRLIHDVYRPLNELYDDLGLEPIQMGNDVGWTTDYGLVEVIFSSKLAKDGQPCLVIEFKVQPRKL